MRGLHQNVVVPAKIERILHQVHVARGSMLVWKWAKRNAPGDAVWMSGLHPLRMHRGWIAMNEPRLPAIEHRAITVGKQFPRQLQIRPVGFEDRANGAGANAMRELAITDGAGDACVAWGRLKADIDGAAQVRSGENSNGLIVGVVEAEDAGFGRELCRD